MREHEHHPELVLRGGREPDPRAAQPDDREGAGAPAARRGHGAQLADRRPGDVAVVYGDASLALKEIGWKAELGLEDMCADSWRWISNNPNGYSA